MKYRVLKEGVSQYGEDKQVGEEIELSDEAVAHLLPEGYVEPVDDAKKPPKKAPVSRRPS